MTWTCPAPSRWRWKPAAARRGRRCGCSVCRPDLDPRRPAGSERGGVDQPLLPVDAGPLLDAETDLLGPALRRSVRRMDDGDESTDAVAVPGCITAGCGRFGRVAEPLMPGPDVVADLDLVHALDALRGESAVAEELAGRTEHERPETEAAIGVEPPVPVDPCLRLGAAQRMRVVRHDARVAEQVGHVREIHISHLPQFEPGRTEDDHLSWSRARRTARGAAGPSVAPARGAADPGARRRGGVAPSPPPPPRRPRRGTAARRRAHRSGTPAADSGRTRRATARRAAASRCRRASAAPAAP